MCRFQNLVLEKKHMYNENSSSIILSVDQQSKYQHYLYYIREVNMVGSSINEK